jgi:hypothetical protein
MDPISDLIDIIRTILKDTPKNNFPELNKLINLYNVKDKKHPQILIFGDSVSERFSKYDKDKRNIEK